MKKTAWLALASLSALLCFCVPVAVGQAVYGSILGTITDPSGAAVNNAKVTVTSQTKNVSSTETTNESGNYSVTHLIPDVYTIRVEGTGFKTLEFKDVQVSADAGSRVDGQFQLGSASEQVEVTAEAPQLKTDRADVATEFDSKYVNDMPILNRNFTTLQLMAPGSQKMVGWSHAATENPQGSQQIFTQGQHFSGTAFELDGTDNQDPILGIIVVNPNLDAVTEAKVALQNYDAEFGKAVSSVVTAQTKSGTNDIHGSGFWFRRTDATQAKDPFTQWSAQPGVPASAIPSSRWQQFGGTVGGPIIKNKLFFFGDYQGTRQAIGVSGLFNVPTNEVQQTCNPATNATSATPGFCDLSQYLSNEVPGGGQVYDPSTGTPGVGQGGTRTPFTNNQIPIADISPAAGKILAAFPVLPATAGILNNYVGAGAGPFSQNSFDARIDFSASSTVSVFGRFSLDYFKLSGTGLLGAVGGPGTGGAPQAPGLAGSSTTHNYSLASGVTKTFSTTWLADFRFGYFKYNPQTQKPDGGTPMTTFGIPGANTSDAKTTGLGAFILGPDPISGEGGDTGQANSGQGLFLSSFGDGLGVARCNCPLTESEQQFQFVNNWTKTKGNHIFKFGADIRYAMNLRIPSDNNRSGEYNFSPEATSSGATGAGGLDLATFLLGEVTSFARYVNNPNLPGANNAAERQKRWFFYGQDTFRVNSKLTLNYGLRWEIYFPETVNAKGNGGFANIVDNGGLGGIRVAGYGSYGSNGNISNDFHAFAPRVGVAYQVTPRTVVRMGYGRSYDIGVFGSNFGHTVTQNLPVLLKQNYDATTYSPTASGAAGGYNPIVDQNGNPFKLDVGPTGLGIDPSTAFPAVPSNGFIPLTAQLSGTHLRPIKQTLPAVDAWNATVQRQLTSTMSLEVAYVGSKGTHGFAGDGPNYDVNPVGLQNFNAVNPLTTAANGKTTLFTQNERRPLCGPEVTVATATQAIGDCSRIGFDLGNYYGNDAASTYNAFEVKVDKRLAQGLQFVSHYTYSHADNFDNNYYAIDHRIAWGPVDFARNHVWVFSPIYELPFGKGKMFMGNADRALDYVVGGWQLSNTTNWSSGLPWTPSFNECGGEQDVGICRPSIGNGSFHTGVKGGIDPVLHQLTFYTPVPNIVTTPGAFVDPGFGNIGNVGRNSFHGPSGFYSDLSVVKRFQIFERLNAQFRMDAFNLFNHPVYAFSANNGAQTCIDCGALSTGQIKDIEFGSSMRELQFALRLDF